ncbi:PLP-dependent cysteine synthase family protein [Kribbella sandramycini]|uniref:Cysteine synthase A n=1 Tax=Kribbella sandramycini TaxID=60450 RepID=A0A7Y4KXJ4_9ACTN|nr:PLP-dependent cysteine synthase family protein [Kribbella sandramycini]MBB6569675.1 cysteine synthase A [Kribbella sandramycini]NOL40493.1 PLP-dependent cysteine synthase family protein [Kribbella sandramycini]
MDSTTVALSHAQKLEPTTEAMAVSAGVAWRTPAGIVGNTPTLWVGDVLHETGTANGYWAKLEGHNPGGIKDRAALHMVRCARARGDLTPGARIVESSSGTLGLGLALAGIVHGHPVTVVTDPGMEPLVVHMLRAYGATVDMVAAPHPEGGWQQARRDRVRTLLADDPMAWCPDQYHNLDNVDAYAGLAAELLAQVGRIDVLVASVGTGGHSAGVSRVLRERCPDLTVVGVDSIRSTIFGQPAGSRLMRGLGSSIYPGNVDYSAFSEVHWVAPSEAVWVCRRLAANAGTTGGWSVGAVGLVADWIARTAPSGTRIAAVFPDGPQRYWDTIFSDEYCDRHDLADGAPALDPDELAHPKAAVPSRWTRCATVIDPRAGER